MLSSTRVAVRVLAFVCAMPMLVIVLMFEIIPLLAVAADSVFKDGALSPGNYADLAGSRYQRAAFLSSLLLSLGTSVIGLAVALPVANMLRRMPGGLQQLVLTYSNIGANFTGFPLAFAFIILFGLNGSFTLLLQKAGLVKELNIYSIGGLALVYCWFQVPLGVLLVYPSLQAITPEIEDAARVVGASRVAFWQRIGLPILAPSLIGTFILLFANAMGTYATAFALAGGNTNLTTIRIGELVAGDVYSDPNLADALAMVLVLSLAVPVLFEQLVLRRMAGHVR